MKDEKELKNLDNHPCKPNVLGHHHLPPHHSHVHMPPHIRSSKIRLDYNEDVIEYINNIYEGNTEYVIEKIENCPPEIKLTLAISLGIKTDLSEYPQEQLRTGRFDKPFLNDQNAKIIAQALQCDDVKAIINLYNNCPPEQAILALAIARNKQTSKESIKPALANAEKEE